MHFVVEMDICADYKGIYTVRRVLVCEGRSSTLSSRRLSNSHHMSRVYYQRAQATMEGSDRAWQGLFLNAGS